MIQGVLSLNQRSSNELYKAYMVSGSIFILRTDNSLPPVLRTAEYKPSNGQLIKDHTEWSRVQMSSAVKKQDEEHTTISNGSSTWRLENPLVNYDFSVAACDKNLFVAHSSVDDDVTEELSMLNCFKRLAGKPSLSRIGNILFLDSIYCAHAIATDASSIAIFSDVIALLSWDGTCTWSRHFPEDILTYPDYNGVCIVPDYVVLVSYSGWHIRVIFFDREDGRIRRSWNLSVPKDGEESGGSISGPITSANGAVFIFRDPYHRVHAFPTNGSTQGRSWRAKGAEAVGRTVEKATYKMDRDDLDGVIIIEGNRLEELTLTLVSTDDMLTKPLSVSDCFEQIPVPVVDEGQEETVAQLLHANQLAALHKAVAEGQVEIAAGLIRNGVDIHQELRNGWTVLCTAAYFGSLGMIQLLLRKNALFNRPDGGLGPLDWAVRQNRVEVAKELIKHGATLGPQGMDHPSLLSIAEDAEYREMVQILLEAGSDG